MQEFTISPQGLKLLEKKLIRNSVITFVAVVSVAAIVIIGHTDETFIYIGVLLIGVVGFTSFNTLKRQKKMFTTYKLTVADDSITRQMDGTHSITILKADIKDIVKGKSGALGIVGDSKLNAIGVPAEVENISKLQEILTEIRPIRVSSTGELIQKYQWVIILPAVASIFFLMASKNAVLSITGSLSFVCLMVWGFVIMQKSNNIEKRVKRMSYISLVPAFFILLGVILKIIDSL
jgi:hypothetical protein